MSIAVPSMLGVSTPACFGLQHQAQVNIKLKSNKFEGLAITAVAIHPQAVISS